MINEELSGYQLLRCSACGSVDGLRPFGDGGLKCHYCGAEYSKKEAERMIIEVKDNKQEEMFRRAKQFETFRDYPNAIAAYQEFSGRYPYDYRGWWGLTRLVNWETWFYQQGVGSQEMPPCCQRALATANESQKQEIQDYFQKQCDACRSEADRKLTDYQQAADAQQAEIQKHTAEVQRLDAQYKELDGKHISVHNKRWKYDKRNNESTLWRYLGFIGLVIAVVGLLAVGLPILLFGAILLVLAVVIRPLFRVIRRNILGRQLKNLDKQRQDLCSMRSNAEQQRIAANQEYERIQQQHQAVMNSSIFLS